MKVVRGQACQHPHSLVEAWTNYYYYSVATTIPLTSIKKRRRKNFHHPLTYVCQQNYERGDGVTLYGLSGIFCTCTRNVEEGIRSLRSVIMPFHQYVCVSSFLRVLQNKRYAFLEERNKKTDVAQTRALFFAFLPVLPVLLAAVVRPTKTIPKQLIYVTEISIPSLLPINPIR